MVKKINKNPFSQREMEIIIEMISLKGDTKAVSTKMGISEANINSVFSRIRRKYDRARLVTQTYEGWRRNECLRKRLY